MNQEILQAQIQMWTRLGRLLGSRIPALQAVESTLNEITEPGIQKFLQSLAAGIQAGKSIAETMEKNPDLFSESLIRMVREIEVDGDLERIAEISDAIQRGEISMEIIKQGVESGSTSPREIVEVELDILYKAIQNSASDIHFIPGREGGLVRFRIDGVLHDAVKLSPQQYQALVSHIKINAGLNMAERRMPQDGWTKAVTGKNEYDIRVTTAQAALGETMTLHILDRGMTVLELEQYVPDDEVRAVFERWIKQPCGLVLTSGPTGSGKTTILYGLLKQLLANPAIKIVSIEDPVEFSFEGMVQLGVQPGSGLTFSSLLRSALRQDPDVIMLGEIRDLETLQVAIQAAISGHLVLSQMHTHNTLEAVGRLVDMNIPWWLLRDSLIGISCQRLARLLCRKCRESYEPSKDDLAGIPVSEELKTGLLYRANGCDECHGTGYRGRMALFEQFEPDAAFWKTVACRDNTQPVSRGMTSAADRVIMPFWTHAWRHIQNGDTSLAEATRVLMNANR